MTPVAAITVPGVLYDESTGSPVPEGLRLYRALASVYRVVLLTDKAVPSLWLMVNGFTEHQHVIETLPEDPGDIPIRRIRQIERMRATGLAPNLLVDPDPSVVSAVIHVGVPCLHYVDPPYGRPEFHPDFKETITPWDQMVTEIDKVRALRALDTRHLDEE